MGTSVIMFGHSLFTNTNLVGLALENGQTGGVITNMEYPCVYAHAIMRRNCCVGT